jgi:hypothetical protein
MLSPAANGGNVFFLLFLRFFVERMFLSVLL